MKAVRFHSFGGFDVLQYEDAPMPRPGSDDVLVQLKAAALNHLDLFVRSGARERNIPLPHILGCEGAGIVTGVGPNVSSVRVGDSVLISPGISCGTCSACNEGRETFCRSYHVLGTLEDGTYAEFVSLPSRNVLPMPDGLGFPEAASIALVFLTAWHMLRTRAQLKAGETVLVHGAGSGVGSAAIQIARMTGATVITTAGTDEKLQKARALGAHELINYQQKDFAAEVRRITGKRGVDVVFEHVGGEVFEKSIPIIAKGGRLVTCGSTTDYNSRIDIRYLYSRQQTLLGSWMGWRSELVELLKSFEGNSATRKLHPVLDSVFPLARAAEAHRRMEARENFGKIVLEM